jgi:hypothetical protein
MAVDGSAFADRIANSEGQAQNIQTMEDVAGTPESRGGNHSLASIGKKAIA